MKLSHIALSLATVMLAPDAPATPMETPEAFAERAGCLSVESCLELATSEHVPAQRRYWAKLFLDEHANDQVVTALAPLLQSPINKLRDFAWWYVNSNPAAWRDRVPDLLAALPLEPQRAYLVADIGGDAAWEGLRTLAGESAQAEPFAEALRRIDRARAVALGFDVILGDTRVVDPDGVIDGIFSEYYASADAGTVIPRLVSVLSGDAGVDIRRRAVVAHRAAVWGGDPMPAVLAGVYAEAPEPLRQALRRHWPDLGTPRERARDLESIFEEDELMALAEAERLGPAARGERQRILALLASPDSLRRQAAQRALHAVAPREWRKRRPELLASPDLSTALTAWRLDPGVSKSMLDEAASRSWYPAMADAFQAWERERVRAAATERWLEQVREARERGEAPPPRPEASGEPLQVLSNDAIYAEPIATACPDESAPTPGGPGSLWPRGETLQQAATEADTPTGELSAALRTEHGWFVGEDSGEFGGRITFNAHGQGTHGGVRTTAEPLAIFPYGGHVYYVAGGSARFRRGVLAELGHVAVAADGVVAESLFTLPSPPTDVVVQDGRLLLKLDGNGWVDASQPASPRWLGCGEAPPKPGQET